MELLKNNDEPMDGEKHELPSSCRLVFGTEKVYIFMRLYCALLSLFDSAKQNMESDVDEMEVDDANSSGQSGYHGFLSTLKELINEDIEFKAYDLRCRNITQKKCHELSAIPRLIEKCADALVKVAREDKLLGLFDFYQLKTMDPVLQRAHSLSIAEDASFRIQYMPTDGCVKFCYLPMEKDMLISPRNSNGSSTLNAEGSSVKADQGKTAASPLTAANLIEDGESGRDTHDHNEPLSKRVKLV